VAELQGTPSLPVVVLAGVGGLSYGALLPTMNTKTMLMKKSWLREHRLLPPWPLPPASCLATVRREAEKSGGWREVLPRCVMRCWAPLAPHPIPAWLHGRCCRCLLAGHRTAFCRDPFRCSRCLENGHRAHECRNVWRPLSWLSSPNAPKLPQLATKHRVPPAPCHAKWETPRCCEQFKVNATFDSLSLSPRLP
jgi:hypothetical protein